MHWKFDFSAHLSVDQSLNCIDNDEHPAEIAGPHVRAACARHIRDLE